MKRAYYDAFPSKFEAVGNGSFRYRFDIQEELSPIRIIPEGTVNLINGQQDVQYSCYEVIVWGTVTRGKITQAVINQMWDPNYEQKLINEYNSAKLGIYSGEEAKKKIAAYNQFLEERAALKDQMDADFEELNIP